MCVCVCTCVCVCVLRCYNYTTSTIFLLFSLYILTQAGHMGSVVIYFAVEAFIQVFLISLPSWHVLRVDPVSCSSYPKLSLCPSLSMCPMGSSSQLHASAWEPRALGMHPGCFINYCRATLGWPEEKWNEDTELLNGWGKEQNVAKIKPWRAIIERVEI